MPDYRKYPPDAPSRRGVWVLVIVVVALLLANLVERTL